MVRNPNGEIMTSTHEAELNLPCLPKKARHVHVLPDIQSDPLLSIGQLCDNDCTVQFDAKQVTIQHKTAQY